MQDVPNIQLELVAKTKVFFDSIESQFIYREKHHRKYRALTNFWAITVVLFIFNILPLFPWLITKINNNPLVSKIVIQGYTIPLDLFLVRWIIFAAVSGIFLFVINKIHSFFDKREDKYSLAKAHLDFALLYKAIKELDVFLINERPEHLQVSTNYLNRYISMSFINFSKKVADETRGFFLPDLLSEIREKREWVQYSDLTSKVLKAFSDFDGKIFERIKQKKEIDIVVKLLNELLIYEYIIIDKVKVEKLSSSVDIKELANPMLEAFTDSMNLIQSFEEVKKSDEQQSSLSDVSKFIDVVTNLFTHQNILLMFFSWLFLLTILFVSLLYIGVKVYSLEIDTTIFIGAASGIILGALTITATIYSKKK